MEMANDLLDLGGPDMTCRLVWSHFSFLHFLLANVDLRRVSGVLIDQGSLWEQRNVEGLVGYYYDHFGSNLRPI